MSPVKTEKKLNKDIVKLIDIITGLHSDLDGGPQDTVRLTTLLEEIKKVVGFDAATVYQCDKKDGSLHMVTSFGGEVELLGQFNLAGGTGLSSWAADSKKPILITDRTSNKNYNPDTDYASFMSVPLLQKELVVGVLNLGSYTPNRFSNEDLQLLELISGLLSLVIERTVLQDTIKDATGKLEKSLADKKQIVKKSVDLQTVKKISLETSKIVHDVNNALSIIFGNIQCMLIAENGMNQKSMSRLRRVEEAAKLISESNEKILEIHDVINKNEPGHDTSILQETSTDA